MGRVRGAGDAFGRFSLSAVSSVSSMVVMARMSQNVLVTLRNSFFSRAPQYQMFSIGRMRVKFVKQRHHCTIRCHGIFHGVGA